MILTFLMVALGWAGNADAHRRGYQPLGPPALPPATHSPDTASGETSGPLSLDPDSYWKRLLTQEQAGDFEQAWKTGMALTNLFPQSPQRGAALLKLAEMARAQGNMAEALELFALVVSLSPGSQEASQARLAAAALEFGRDLSQGDPVQTLRRFLEKVSGLPPGYSHVLFQETLRTGWQEVTHKVRATSPLPLSLVEDLLVLWDMQPQGVGPPEAARLLAELLKKKGLWGEAQSLLAKMADNKRSGQHNLGNSYSLEPSWLSSGCKDFLDILSPFPESDQSQKCFLRAWLPRWQGLLEPLAPPGVSFLSWLLPQKAYAGWLQGKIPPLEPGLLSSWTAPLACLPGTELAKYYMAQGNFSRSPQMPQPLEDSPMRGDLAPFYQDRQGLSRWEEGRLEDAQATFQELAQNNDPFWQHLARVRLADMELSRLQAELVP